MTSISCHVTTSFAFTHHENITVASGHTHHMAEHTQHRPILSREIIICLRAHSPWEHNSCLRVYSTYGGKLTQTWSLALVWQGRTTTVKSVCSLGFGMLSIPLSSLVCAQHLHLNLWNIGSQSCHVTSSFAFGHTYHENITVASGHTLHMAAHATQTWSLALVWQGRTMIVKPVCSLGLGMLSIPLSSLVCAQHLHLYLWKIGLNLVIWQHHLP